MSDSKDHDQKEMTEMDQEIMSGAAQEAERRRGMVFLPNALTTGAMFFGFYAIMQAMNQKFEHAVWAIVAAGILDMLDGRVARLVKGTSAFGEQYDSLSDLISFGFAPAMIGYYWALKPLGKVGWAVAFLFLACAAIRLAKFNTLTGEEESRKYFRGIPSPAAAGLVIIMVMMHLEYAETGGLPLESDLLRGVMLIWMVMLSLLMVSNIRFRTFKDIKITKYGPIFPLVGLAAMIAVFMARPQETLFCVGLVYLSWGLIEGGIIIRRREGVLRMEQRKMKREMRVQRKLAKRQAKLARKEAGKEPPVRLAQ